jgi:two-component system phosphate regulon sensor histidine kinase PhoR
VLIRLLTREIRLAQLKADFVSNLSHELKTPITSISLFTEMLEDGKLTTPADQTEAFSVLAQESRRLQRIVDRMINVARGEARSSPYTLEPGDLNRTVLEAATRFRRIITEPGLDLDIKLHPGRLAIQMDTQALDDVVTNLLSNAWKYKRENRARIAIRTARRGRFAEIVVQDDGIGIPRVERRKVFEMFYRSEQLLTLPVAGTGLGLALVRSVVTGHKGRIRLDAAPGGPGSVFTVQLPLDRKAEEELAQRPETTSGASDAPPHGKVVAS